MLDYILLYCLINVPSYSFTIPFNIILQTTPRYSKWFHFSGFHANHLYEFLCYYTNSRNRKWCYAHWNPWKKIAEPTRQRESCDSFQRTPNLVTTAQTLSKSSAETELVPSCCGCWALYVRPEHPPGISSKPTKHRYNNPVLADERLKTQWA